MPYKISDLSKQDSGADIPWSAQLELLAPDGTSKSGTVGGVHRSLKAETAMRPLRVALMRALAGIRPANIGFGAGTSVGTGYLSSGARHSMEEVTRIALKRRLGFTDATHGHRNASRLEYKAPRFVAGTYSAWNSGTAYAVGDAVSYTNVSPAYTANYVAIQAGTNHVPPQFPDGVTGYWALADQSTGLGYGMNAWRINYGGELQLTTTDPCDQVIITFFGRSDINSTAPLIEVECSVSGVLTGSGVPTYNSSAPAFPGNGSMVWNSGTLSGGVVNRTITVRHKTDGTRRDYFVLGNCQFLDSTNASGDNVLRVWNGCQFGSLISGHVFENRTHLLGNRYGGGITPAMGTGVAMSRGAWNSGTTYNVNDVVVVSGVPYRCISSHTNHTPPNATYWEVNSYGFDGVIIEAGANDNLASYKANLKPYIDLVHTECTNSMNRPTIIITPPEPSVGGNSGAWSVADAYSALDWADYIASLYSNVCVWSWAHVFGNVKSPNDVHKLMGLAGTLGNDVHPNDVGHRLYGESVAGFIWP